VVSTESPAVARRRLRLVIRKAREASGHTQSDVARELEWSLSKVNRIESGEVTISNNDLKALLVFLGITDHRDIERLTNDARASRRRGWWDDPRYRRHVDAPTLQLLQFESQASAIRTFNPTLVPGVLQTSTYAEAILDFWRDDLSSADRAARLEVRLKRWNEIFNQESSPQYLLLLDESVILREIGGPEGMAEQLQSLLDALRLPPVILRIVPLAASGAAGIVGPFTIFDLEDEENAVLYRESDLQDRIVQAPDALRRYRRTFEQLWVHSLSEDATARLISARLAALLSSFDRRDLPG
jgi:transcriptional regulator with XRE-family HTH domain